ncbi:biopolymer transporter ExbD [Tenacibaculum sp. SG-28]|nr:biopolymer transporter ExbD [Tenacibaculum sp. SG-28]
MLTSTLVTVSAIDVILPKAGGKTENQTSVAVTITENSSFYIDKKEVSAAQLELELLTKVGVNKEKTVVIRGDQNVPYKLVMQVIDIANKNKLKMILAVKGK